MFRASGRHAGLENSLDAVMRGDPGSDVPHGGALLAFADAVLRSDEAVVARTREALVFAMGEAAMLDAAAVIGGFDGIARIADAIGIPLEPEKTEATADFFGVLEIGQFRQEKV